MSPLIQDPTVGRKLQRGFRLTDLPDSVLAPEIVGVVLLEDWSDPLSDISRGCQGSASNGAVVGENGIVTIVRVGLGDQYELVVTEFWCSSTTTQLFQLIQATALAGQVASDDTIFTDFNLPGRPTSQVGFDTQVGVPAGSIIWEGEVLANTTFRMPVDLRIGKFGEGPGLTALLIAAASANTLMRGGFKWTESPPLG